MGKPTKYYIFFEKTGKSINRYKYDITEVYGNGLLSIATNYGYAWTLEGARAKAIKRIKLMQNLDKSKVVEQYDVKT